MSNHLAIATVTATFQRLLQAAIQSYVEGAKVTTVRPHEVGSGAPQSGINLFLYQVVNNAMWRQNAEMRSRRQAAGGKHSYVAIDLHYIISFYGNELTLEPQRLMGTALSTLADRPVMTKDLIRGTMRDASYSFLTDSDLIEQVEEINLIPLDLSLEDLSKVWSVFFQTPYSLSIAYKATVVMLEGQTPSQKALPVRARQFGGIMPFSNQPKIDQVVSHQGQFEPILADSTVLIKGKHLKSDITQVWIGEAQVTPTEITDTQIKLPLSSLPAEALRCGLQSLQVVHRSSKAVPAQSNNGATTSQHNFRSTQMLPSNQQMNQLAALQSNAFPFVLRPTITKITVSKKEVNEENLRSAEIRVRADLTVGKKQRVLLALNEIDNNQPAAYLFEAAPRQTDVIWVSFPVEQMKGGRYLARLLVDGAESQLIVDTEPDSPTFNQYVGPRISI